jgi:transcriptional regulator
MYRPPPVSGHDPALANEVIDAHPFALLLTTEADGSITSSHLPILRVEDTLVGHLSVGNPHAHCAAARATIIFQGPHGYVSPTWYGTPAAHVPTWNYVAVHVTGAFSFLGEHETAAALDQLVERFEAMWTVSPDVRGRLSSGIRGFRVQMEQVDTRLKLSQNREDADALRVTEHFRRTDPALATWMRRALQARRDA